MRKGFTLIEIMVALGLVTAMMGLIVPSYLNINKTQKVVAEAQGLRQAYIQAKDNAISGKNGCAVGAFMGWRVVVVGSPQMMTIEGYCGNGTYPTAGSTFSSRTEPVAAGLNVSFAGLASVADGVLFYAGGQGVYPGTNITVSVTGFGNTRSFTISGSGVMGKVQ